MPWVPEARCSTPGCSAMAVPRCKGHCYRHRPIGWNDRPSRHTLEVDQRTFGRIRRKILRPRPLCAICQDERATEVDHIVPVSRGGALYSRENLQPLCHECHFEKTQGERFEDLARRRRSEESGKP